MPHAPELYADAASQDTRREYRMKVKFGLSVGQYEMLLRIQNGVCALCKRPPKIKRLHVDHDHKTGVIRGLLCHRCNRGLGYIQDPDLLRRAADYVGGKTGYTVPKRTRKKKKARLEGAGE